MGHMKEMYIDICNANNGKIPHDLTISDLALMKDLEIYEWYTYCKYKREIKNMKLYIDNQKIYDTEDFTTERWKHQKKLKNNDSTI